MKKMVTVRTPVGAFSLVELSIVLVILGLLVGGILAGQSLIRAAQVRSILSQQQTYRTAINTFRDKYFALPGDMANATSVWGSVGGTGSDATCQNTVATGAPTCNGNGNGLIDVSVVSPTDEGYRNWQHLSNAGLIEGRYTGTRDAAGSVPGLNIPATRFTNVGWNMLTIGVQAGNANTFTATDYGNTLSTYALYGFASTAGSFPFKPEEAWNMDSKVDDGLPVTGSVLSNKGNGTATYCTTAAGVAPPGDVGSTYRLDNPNTDCIIIFRRAY